MKEVVKPAERLSEVVSVRMSETDRKMYEKLAKELECSVSKLILSTSKQFISDNQVKGE
jgi:hypothetical protein